MYVDLRSKTQKTKRRGIFTSNRHKRRFQHPLWKPLRKEVDPGGEGCQSESSSIFPHRTMSDSDLYFNGAYFFVYLYFNSRYIYISTADIHLYLNSGYIFVYPQRIYICIFIADIYKCISTADINRKVLKDLCVRN